MPGQQSGIAAGAQAGSAFGPWGAAVGGALGAASDIAGAGGPMSSGSGQWDMRNLTDGSGWTVSTGGGSAQGGARNGGNDQGKPSGGGFGQSFGMPQQAGMGWLGMAAGLGLLAYLVTK